MIRFGVLVFSQDDRILASAGDDKNYKIMAT